MIKKYCYAFCLILCLVSLYLEAAEEGSKNNLKHLTEREDADGMVCDEVIALAIAEEQNISDAPRSRSNALSYSLTLPDYPKILIKFPTRGRCEKFFTTLDLYYAHLSYEYPVHFLITCDQDDPSMNTPETITRLESYPQLNFYFGESKSKIEACNADIEKHDDFDILILVSDDMIPRIKGFDAIIAYHMTKSFPDLDGILHFDDGYQHANLNTLPIMGKNFYRRFGYIYHPSYKSFFCDNEMTEIAHLLKKSVYFNQMLIEHCHPAAYKTEMDDLYRFNDRFYWIDHQTYLERQAIHFGLPLAN